MKMVRKEITNFAWSQWGKHLAAVPDKALKATETQPIKQKLEGLIIGPEDKAPHRLHVFCPKLVADMTKATFMDDTIFEQIHTTPEQAELMLANSLPERVRKQCRWAFRKVKGKEKVLLPRAFILPKRKNTSPRPGLSSQPRPAGSSVCAEQLR